MANWYATARESEEEGVVIMRLGIGSPEPLPVGAPDMFPDMRGLVRWARDVGAELIEGYADRLGTYWVIRATVPVATIRGWDVTEECKIRVLVAVRPGTQTYVVCAENVDDAVTQIAAWAARIGVRVQGYQNLFVNAEGK